MERTSVDGVQKNIQEILARSPKTRIILHGIFPRGEKPSPEREAITAINRQIAGFAEDKRVSSSISATSSSSPTVRSALR
ncbi:MAG: hypothetical protein H0V44_10740 [Planctomycetes bacterium]|nr:hypothetical protein [Planctomycetota bacterium]